MIVVFVFACLQQLEIGVFFIKLIGVCGVFIDFKKILKYQNIDAGFKRQIIEFLVICFLAFLASWGSDYWAWDEFSHWGSQVEFLIKNNNLQINSEVLLFPDYIPGLTLFRYFGRSILPQAGAAAAYFVTWVLVFSAIYCVSYSCERSRYVLTVLVVFFAYLFFFQSLVLTLYSDHVQGILFLCVLRYSQIVDDKDDFIVFILLSISIVLIKHVGLIFAVVAGMSFLVDRLFIRKERLVLIIKRLIIYYVFVLIPFVIWLIYVKHYNLNKVVVDLEKLNNGLSIFENIFNGILSVLNNKFPHAALVLPAFVAENLKYELPLILVIILLLFVGTFFSFLLGVDRRKRVINWMFAIISCFGYLVFLGYVNRVTPWAGDIYSFSRYFLTLFFALFLLQFFVLRDSVTMLRVSSIFVFYVLLGVLVAPPLGRIFVFQQRSAVAINNEYEEKVVLVKRYANNKNVVWYINDEINSFPYFVFRMKAMPLRVADYSKGWGIYLNNNLDDISKIQEEIYDFKRHLCDVSYVYVDDMPKGFWRKYSAVFGDKVGRFYRVTLDSGNECRAELLEN